MMRDWYLKAKNLKESEMVHKTKLIMQKQKILTKKNKTPNLT